MPKILGLYSSTYAEPRKNLVSLGGEPYTLLDNNSPIGNVFNDVDEYESTNSMDDFRVIYLVNMTNNKTRIKSCMLNVSINYNDYLDKTAQFHLFNINLRVFNPPYSVTNYVHPIISANGTFRETGLSMRSLISEESTQFSYGKSVIINLDLASSNFYPVVLHRIIRGPVPYLRNFKFTLNTEFSAV